MTHLEILYTANSEDRRRYIVSERQRQFSNGSCLISIFGSIILLPLGLGVLRGKLPATVMLGPILMFLMAYLHPKLAAWSETVRAGGKPRHETTTSVSVRLTDTGVEIARGDSITRTRWSAIEGIAVDNWSLYFKPSSVDLYVPKRAFSSIEQRWQFEEIAERLRVAAREHGASEAQPNVRELPATTVQWLWDSEFARAVDDEGGCDMPSPPSRNDYLASGWLTVEIALFCFIGYFAIPSLAQVFRGRAAVVPGTSLMISGPDFGMIGVALLVGGVFIFKLLQRRSGNSRTSKPSHFTIRVDDHGATRILNHAEITVPWTSITTVDIGPKLIWFRRHRASASIPVPRTAFPTEDDLTYFVDIARAYIDSARTGQPPVFPESPSWPPPPNG